MHKSKISIQATAALLLFGLAACQPADQSTPFSVTLPSTQAAVAIATAIPTTERPPTETFTPTPTLTLTATPSRTLSPTPTFTPSQTFTPSATPTFARVEHFYIGRPISRDAVDWVDRNYPYGSTELGRYPVHHGVEFQNPLGTPVQAAGAGEVYYAGDDYEVLFGPKNDYYGNLVVIKHDFPTPDGLTAYTLYGHLNRVTVPAGDRVEAGDKIGAVGGTGVAIGAHLHFEVRLGDPHDFYATRNPEMWILPYPTFGMIAGKVTDLEGNLLHGTIIKVYDLNNPDAEIRYAYAYENDEVNGDLVWEENFTLGDLPEGNYEVVISERNGKVHFRQTVSVVSGRITWVEIVLDQ